MRPKFSVHSSTIALSSAPINPAWIIEGEPEARNNVLERSGDGLGCALVWECTAGIFEWHYDIDETIYIIEGCVVISCDDSPPRRVGPGDVVFFPNGSVARWHVESYVRKVAYCHRTLPGFTRFPIAILRKLKNLLRGPELSGLMNTG